MVGWKDVLKVEYNDPHKNALKFHGLWVIFYSTKWPTVLVHKIKGKTCNFEAYLCRSLYSTVKTSF